MVTWPQRSTWLAANLPTRNTSCDHDPVLERSGRTSCRTAPKLAVRERARSNGRISSHVLAAGPRVGDKPGAKSDALKIRGHKLPQSHVCACRSPYGLIKGDSYRHKRAWRALLQGCREAASTRLRASAFLGRAPPANICGGFRSACLGLHSPGSKNVLVEEARRPIGPGAIKPLIRQTSG